MRGTKDTASAFSAASRVFATSARSPAIAPDHATPPCRERTSHRQHRSPADSSCVLVSADASQAASLNALAPLRDELRHAHQTIRKPEHRNDREHRCSLSTCPRLRLRQSLQRLDKHGSVIRGFIVCGSNSTPSRSFGHGARRSDRQEAKPRMRLVQLPRHCQLERLAAAPSPRRPTASARDGRAETRRCRRTLAFQHARPHRPQPAAGAQLTQIARREDNHVGVNAFRPGNVLPFARTSPIARRPTARPIRRAAD